MKAKELRIGNYLLNAKNDDYFEVELNDLEIIVTGKSKSRPIPLTEDWLLKFGFKKSIVKEPWFEKNKIEVFKYSKGNFFLLGGNHTAYGIGLHDIWQGMEINIQYVHQLQNLYFALTNEELTLTK